MKTHHPIFLCLSLCFPSHTQLTSAQNNPAAETPIPSTLSSRPSDVQTAVDEAFQANRQATARSWLYNGSPYYELLGIDDEKLIKSLSDNNDKKDIYIIDVGCANGLWGTNATRVLLEHEGKKSGKHFHIFSLTGGKECDEATRTINNVTHYQLNQVKIENIDEELTKRGFDLKDKVDLIVSNWTLRHLVDPFGTLNRMFNLLTPAQGMLMSNGFLFKFNDSDKIQAFPPKNECLLARANATALFRHFSLGRDAGQFLLMRNDAHKLALPLEYTGSTSSINSRTFQCASGRLTVYKGSPGKANLECNGEHFEHCWNRDNQKSKDLYLRLQKHGHLASNHQKPNNNA